MWRAGKAALRMADHPQPMDAVAHGGGRRHRHACTVLGLREANVLIHPVCEGQYQGSTRKTYSDTSTLEALEMVLQP